MAELPDHVVALFDPGNPTEPRLELAANFDPRSHTRWDSRPAVAPLDLAAVGGEGGKPLLNEQEVDALGAAGMTSLRAILEAGADRLQAHGVRRKVASELVAWAHGRHAAPWALAEIAHQQAIDLERVRQASEQGSHEAPTAAMAESTPQADVQPQTEQQNEGTAG